MSQTERRFIQDVPKYFIHGLLYSIIGTLAAIVFSLISVIATLIVATVATVGGTLIGYVVLGLFFIILLFLVLFTAGLINAALARSFWKANPPSGFKSYVGHGAALVFLLIIFGLPNMAIDFVFPNLDFVTFVILAIPRLVIYAIIDGFVGRWVSYGFSTFPTASKTEHTEEGIVGTCPRCGVDTVIKMRYTTESKTILCPSCGEPFEIQLATP
ncbi:MAG: hypothetical protein ACFFCP_07190 [Promethearchaeota archaeon]